MQEALQYAEKFSQITEEQKHIVYIYICIYKALPFVFNTEPTNVQGDPIPTYYDINNFSCKIVTMCEQPCIKSRVECQVINATFLYFGSFTLTAICFPSVTLGDLICRQRAISF